MELPPNNRGSYHKNALALSTARACLSVVLEVIKPRKLYVPFYTCDALLQPITDLQICYEFYPIAPELSSQLPNIEEDEYAIYINYFGLCTAHVQTLLSTYPNRVIIDNSQAFFERAYPETWSFNSARKFFGVPDGAYLYSPLHLKNNYQRNDDFEFVHLVNRFIGKREQAYAQFIAYEKSLDCEIKGISPLSERLLSLVNFKEVAEARQRNFSYYAKRFGSINKLSIDWDPNSIPFVYPLLLEQPISKQALFEQRIFVATYWQDVLQRNVAGFEFEKLLARQLLPLPIDHRYDIGDCRQVAEAVEALLEK